MDRVSRKKAATFGVLVALALALVTVGFVAFRSTLGAEQASGKSFGGVGLEITKQEGEIVVISTIGGSPADKAGLEAGDRIVEINGEPLAEDPNINEVVSKLRGEPGTEVTVTVKRGEETKTVTIKRAKIKVPELPFRIIERKAPEQLWPFREDWPWAWWGADKDAMKEYREALRKLEEARRKLWRSFPDPRPRWQWREWRLPPGLFRPLPVPDWTQRIPDWEELFERPDVKEDLRMEMDVTETDDAITVRCDIPGMDKEDIDITLRGNVLTIKGQRKVEEETKDKEGRVIRKERRFGSFARSFTLPGKVNTEDIKTSYENGVLTIIVPREKPKPEKEEEGIKIKIGTI